MKKTELLVILQDYEDNLINLTLSDGIVLRISKPKITFNASYLECETTNKTYYIPYEEIRYINVETGIIG